MPTFVTREALSRRTFLRGAGAAIALPWLEAMLPRAAIARGLVSAQGSPLRFAFLFVPNGKWMQSWTPAPTAAMDGGELELSPTLEPLAALKPQLLVLSGLAQDNAHAKGDGPGDHARAAACFLTGAHPRKTEGADINNGISIDQLLSERIGQDTRFPSLELGCEAPLTSGGCDSGYSCAYSCNISWKSPTTPQLKETDPRLVFERLFAEDGLTPEQRAKRLARRKSLLDYAREDAARLKVKLGATDRRKLDEYLTAVREIEQRIAKAEADAAARPQPAMAMPAGIPSDFGEHVRVLCDLLVLAFQSDVTRVATHMIANDGNNKSFPWLAVPDGHHEISHHGGDAGKIEKIQKVDRFHVEQLGYLLSKMAAASDGDGSLLDHSLVLYGSGISDGNAHNHDELPILLAGRGNGTVTPGRHLRFARGTPLCNLFVGLLDRAGVREAAFGDSNGRLEGI